MVTTVNVSGEQVIRGANGSLVASKSQPGGWYLVKPNAAGLLVCQCKGYSFRSHCRHVEAVALLEWQAEAALDAKRAAALAKVSDLYD